MKTVTNHTVGARGINLKDAGTHWVEPGKSVEVSGAGTEKDPHKVKVGGQTFEVVGSLPDFGKPVAASTDDAELIEAVQAENEKLKAQVGELTKERDALKAENEKLKKPAA